MVAKEYTTLVKCAMAHAGKWLFPVESVVQAVDVMVDEINSALKFRGIPSCADFVVSYVMI